MVGGSDREIELQVVNLIEFNSRVKTFNAVVDADFILDLNLESTHLVEIFDLVICCQVLEHIHNVENAIENLKKLTRQGGFVYLNVPFSNMVHYDSVSPFYSSGYSSSFLAKKFNSPEWKIVACFDLGTKRLYNFIHFLQRWPLVKEHDNPLTTGLRSNSRKFFLKYLLQVKYLRCFFLTPSLKKNSQFSTESLIFVTKN